MRLKKYISIIMVVLLLLPVIPVYAAQNDVLGIMFSWSDNDSEFIAPFEEGKTLSYYTVKMQQVPSRDGMKFAGWKLHGTTGLLNDNSVITAEMRDAETPEIIWIEAVFEKESAVLGIMFSWSDNDSEFIAPFEEGKTLSYYTAKMQQVPSRDGMKFAGWKLHGTTELLNDSSVITAEMRDAETPEIIWIEAVFEKESAVLGIMFSWSDNDSEFIAPFEEGKTLSYYTAKMQQVPSRDGMKFAGWKLHGTIELLSDSAVIAADMCEAEVPEIIWIEAVFEEINPDPEPSDPEIVPSDKENDMDWYWTLLMMLQNTKYDVTASAGEGGSITNAGTTKVKYGSSITYSIIPDEGYEIESVRVNGKEVGAVTAYTFKKVRSNQSISAAFKKAAEPEWANPFIDISKSDDYYAAIEFVYENNLFKGTSETTFAPDTTMSRGMFVTVLGRLAKVNAAAYTHTGFSDVDADQYYAPYVAWAVKKGIALGYGDGTFGVNDDVTVEQAIVFIARFAKLYNMEIDNADMDFTAYADINDVSEWAFMEMLWALDNGIYDAEGEILNPQGKAERWLVAEMVYNFCSLYWTAE